VQQAAGYGLSASTGRMSRLLLYPHQFLCHLGSRRLFGGMSRAAGAIFRLFFRSFPYVQD
jgi:hypothetical protein